MSDVTWHFSATWPEEKTIRPKFSGDYYISTVARHTTEQGSIRYQSFNFTKEDAHRVLKEIFPKNAVHVYDCDEKTEPTINDRRVLRWCFGVVYYNDRSIQLVTEHDKYDLTYTIKRRNFDSLIEQLGFISLKWMNISKDDAHKELAKIFPPNAVITLYNSEEAMSCPFQPPIRGQNKPGPSVI